ncbi:MAG: hypothetical protein PWP08_1293 [Methanofollis sp.]|nr:hypothetical protein [Methanofollis sp.]
MQTHDAHFEPQFFGTDTFFLETGFDGITFSMRRR